MDTQRDNPEEMDRTIPIDRTVPIDRGELPDGDPQAGKAVPADSTSVESRTRNTSRLSFFSGMFGVRTVNISELVNNTGVDVGDDLEVRKGNRDEDFVDFNENFELKGKIADGGQGSISQAVDRRLSRVVAVKTLHKNLRERSKCRSAFIAEAKVTGQLDHPAIVPVHGLYGDSEHNLHLAMKLIRGNTLKHYIDKTVSLYEQMPRFQVARNEHRMLPQRLDVFLRVCEAIAYAHHKKVIHRDLKPENIMIGSFSETYVMDWGIAEHQSWRDSGGQDNFSGTVQYVAPEIINRQPYDSRSDIYALGLILFEIVYLKVAYPSKSLPEAVEVARNCRVAAYTHRFRCRVDRDLEMIVRKTLATRPAERYQNVKALMKDIRSYLRFDEVSAHPDNLWGRISRYFRRKYRFFLFCWVFLLFSGMCAASYYLYREMKEQEVRRSEEAAFAEIYSQGVHAATQLDYRLHTLESLLTTVAWETALLLEGPLPDKAAGKFYSNLDGADSDTAPPDYAYSPAYHRKIALDSFVYKEPPGEKVPGLEETLLRLEPLNRGFFRVMSHSLSEVSLVPAGEKEQKEMIRTLSKPPFSFVYTGFENGLHVSYPYRGDYRDSYDPRKRSWYRLAMDAANYQAVWSEPYVDNGFSREEHDPELIVTCARAIVGNDGKAVGVAGADVSLGRLLDLMLRSGNASPAIRTQYLVDETGRIIVGSGLDGKAEITPEGVQFKMFRDPELLKTMWGRRNGRLFRMENGIRRLYFFQKIETLRWLYIERIDFSGLVRSKQKNTTNRILDYL